MPAEPLPFAEFSAHAVSLYSAPRYSRTTRLRVARVLRELAALGLASTADLTTAAMAAYVRSKGPDANPNTVLGLLSTAAALCSLAHEEGWLERKPAWRRVRPRKASPTRNRPPSFDQIRALLIHLDACAGSGGWADRRLAALAWTVALTGLRLREATHLKPEDLTLTPRRPRLRVVDRRRLKTEASARVVYLPDRLAAVLSAWLPEATPEWVFPGARRVGPWDGGTAEGRPLGALRAAARRVSIDRITWHALRHAYATSAFAAWALPAWVTQRQMGHTDIRTTMGYAHLDGVPRIGDEVRGIDYRPSA